MRLNLLKQGSNNLINRKKFYCKLYVGAENISCKMHMQTIGGIQCKRLVPGAVTTTTYTQARDDGSSVRG